MNQNVSALKSHFLSSILPYQEGKQSQYFLKTKQFYKPQQFIWNNPHRTSKRLYPYYHQFQEDYQTKRKPEIEKLQQQDRINMEQQRIRRLLNFRIQTRQKFFERQRSRQQLQVKTDSRTRSKRSSTLQPKYDQQSQNPVFGSLKTSTYRGQSQSNYITAHIEQTYQKGVTKYDNNLSRIRKMVTDQVLDNHKKIRFQFQKRKENNDILNNTSKIKGRKSVGVLKYDQISNE